MKPLQENPGAFRPLMYYYSRPADLTAASSSAPCSWDKKKSSDRKVHNMDSHYEKRADALWFLSSYRDSNIGLFGGGAQRAGVNEIMVRVPPSCPPQIAPFCAILSRHGFVT